MTTEQKLVRSSDQEKKFPSYKEVKKFSNRILEEDKELLNRLKES